MSSRGCRWTVPSRHTKQDDINKITSRIIEGYTMRQIADQLGWSFAKVNNIVTQKTEGVRMIRHKYKQQEEHIR